MQNKLFLSEISSIESSDVYMSLKTVMFEIDTPNLNSVLVTSAFVEEIINNQSDYIGVPLVCDTEALFNRKKLTHMYNENDDSFATTQIGSFYSFEVKGNKLIGSCRIPKRNPEVCSELCRLFELGQLKFSFEIQCTSCSETEEGITIIDAEEHNKLTALCVVTNPACPASVALQMVAENDCEKENENKQEALCMNENEIVNNIPEVNTEATTLVANAATEMVAEEHEGTNIATEEATEEIVAEQSEVQETSANEETAIAEEPELTAETEEAECKNKSEEEDASCKSKPCSEEEEASCKKPCSEDENASCKKPYSEDEEAECGKKKAEEEPCVEREDDGLKDFITSLVSRIEALEAKLAEFESTAAFCRPAFSNATNFTSEVHVASAEEVNPMVGDMSLDTGWTLLEKEEPRTSWTLL